MRPLSLLLPASLLLASSATAQNLPYPPAEAAPLSTVEVTAPVRPIQIMHDEAQHITGAYAMSNGWRLNVQPSWNHIDATIDKQRPIRLLAVAPYRFASLDGNVIMEFNRGARGDDMMMSYRPNPRLAWVVLTSMPIAQR